MSDFRYSGGAITDFAQYIVQELQTQSITASLGQIEAILQAWRAVHNDDPISLSTVEPDFEQIRLRMMDYLRDVDAWKDLLTAGVGQTVLEIVAAAAAFAQFGVQRSVQETFFDTASNASSILTLSRTLGVHLLRKRPPFIEATMTRSTSDVTLVIPARTQFAVNGIPHFNRSSYSMAIGVTSIEIVLYQGEIKTTQFQSNGEDFQRYVIGDADWTTSDNDLWLSVDGDEYLKTTEGLWKLAANEKAFYENSLPTGEVEIIFGNSVNGARPSNNSIIEISWAKTTGADQPFASAGDNVTSGDIADLSGEVTTGSRNGDNERSSEFYRIVSPYIFSATARAVTKNDYKAVILTYPTVLDAVARGQKEINPDITFALNRCEITLLTNTNWTSGDWNTFVDWLDTKGMMALNYIRVDPTPTPVNLDVQVWCRPQSDLAAVQRAVQTAIGKFFSPRLGMIGYPVYLSDLHAMIIDASTDIDFIKINTPASDIAIGELQYASLGTLTLTMNWSVRGNVQGI